MSRPRHGALRQYLIGTLTRLGEMRRDAIARGLPPIVTNPLRDAEQSIDEAIVELERETRREQSDSRQPELGGVR